MAVAASGINPGDVKKRQDTFGVGMPFPRVVPHSDGAGVIEAVGEGISAARVGERVWCFGAQSYRPFGTAAEYVVVPAEQAIPLPGRVSFEQGACLGIPGITAHRAVHAAGPVEGGVVLVQGGAGAVGQCAVALARHAGALLIATVRSERDVAIAQRAGAHRVVVTGGRGADEIVELVRAHAPGGVDHVVEVAFDANVSADERLLKLGGSIATYATGDPAPAIPFWPLVFKNLRLFFLGSDDFPPAGKAAAAQAFPARPVLAVQLHEAQRRFERLFVRLELHERKSAADFLGLGEGAVDYSDLSLRESDALARRGWGEPAAYDHLPRLDRFRDQLAHGIHEFLRRRALVLGGLDHHHESHRHCSLWFEFQPTPRDDLGWAGTPDSRLLQGAGRRRRTGSRMGKFSCGIGDCNRCVRSALWQGSAS
jgi:NADPH2:quinone reductase